MKLSALGALIVSACATAPHTSNVCGNAAPVDVIVDSNQFADVVIRDADGNRLGIAPGHHVSRFRFCAHAGMAARFILDPIGGGMGYLIDGGMDPVPGSTVIMQLGSELRISFATVVPPSE